MILTIQTVSQEFTKSGAEYRKVTGVTGDGKQTTKSVFDHLKDKWELLQENATLDFTMVQKGQFWNVTDINLIGLPSPTEPEILEEDLKLAEKAKAEMTKDDWAEKDRIKNKSIERQVALKSATEIAVAKINKGEEMSTMKILTIAEVFEGYLEHGIIVESSTKTG